MKSLNRSESDVSMVSTSDASALLSNKCATEIFFEEPSSLSVSSETSMI